MTTGIRAAGSSNAPARPPLAVVARVAAIELQSLAAKQRGSQPSKWRAIVAPLLGVALMAALVHEWVLRAGIEIGRGPLDPLTRVAPIFVAILCWDLCRRVERATTDRPPATWLITLPLPPRAVAAGRLLAHGLSGPLISVGLPLMLATVAYDERGPQELWLLGTPFVWAATSELLARSLAGVASRAETATGLLRRASAVGGGLTALVTWLLVGMMGTPDGQTLRSIGHLGVAALGLAGGALGRGLVAPIAALLAAAALSQALRRVPARPAAGLLPGHPATLAPLAGAGLGRWAIEMAALCALVVVSRSAGSTPGPALTWLAAAAPAVALAARVAVRSGQLLSLFAPSGVDPIRALLPASAVAALLAGFGSTILILVAGMPPEVALRQAPLLMATVAAVVPILMLGWNGLPSATTSPILLGLAVVAPMFLYLGAVPHAPGVVLLGMVGVAGLTWGRLRADYPSLNDPRQARRRPDGLDAALLIPAAGILHSVLLVVLVFAGDEVGRVPSTGFLIALGFLIMRVLPVTAALQAGGQLGRGLGQKRVAWLWFPALFLAGVASQTALLATVASVRPPLDWLRGSVLQILDIVVLGPLLEEWLFRGVALVALGRAVGARAAIVILAAAFAGIHLTGPWHLLFLLGLVFGVIADRGGWKLAAAAHAGGNLAVVGWALVGSQ